MKIHTARTFTVLLLIAFGAMPAMGQFDAALRRITGGGDKEATRQIAHFKLKGILAETPVKIPPLFGDEPPLSLKALTERLKAALHDPGVVAVVIDLQDAALGLAQMEEVHAAMRKFAAVDKDVYIHADTLTTLTYALASGGSHISMVPTGDLWLLGLRSESPYLRGMFDKIGMVPDFEQCGNFKSAGEMFTNKAPSPEAAAMKTWLLDSLYEGYVKRIAEGRNLSPDKVRDIIDRGPYNAEEALKAGLIDSVKHRQDFVTDLKSRYGDGIEVVTNYGKKDDFDIPDDNIFALFDFMMKLFNPQPKVYTEPSVAMVYVEGPIMTGEDQPSLFGGASGAFSSSIRRALDRAAKDDTVKAVVLRVDSPGGSALASEIILDASRRVAAKKPLIVSMGNVAGSGGYYVTCASETIFADPTTITASIGVISGKLITTGMWEKLGITWHEDQRGKMAAILSNAEPWNDAERAKMRHYMETVYATFKKHVTEARGDRLKKPIDDIAGGRVFTGAQALELGLVDQLGSLDDAVRHAAKRAGLSEYEIRVIPEPPGIFDIFAPKKDRDKFAGLFTNQQLNLAEFPFVQSMLPTLAKIDPQRCRTLLQALKRIELIHGEGVIMMMPEEWLVR